MPLIAVLTGDVIGSTNLPEPGRRHLGAGLRLLLDSSGLAPLVSNPEPLGGQIFRGDSFQLVLAGPEAALGAALHLSCRMRLHQEEKGFSGDLRIAIGLGRTEELPAGSDPGTWDGDAFRRSGRLIDDLARYQRIAVQTPWREVNAELGVSCSFLDHLLRQWSKEQVFVIQGTLEGLTQATMANREHVSQSAIAQRIRSAGGHSVKLLLDRFRALVTSHQEK